LILSAECTVSPRSLGFHVAPSCYGIGRKFWILSSSVTFLISGRKGVALPTKETMKYYKVLHDFSSTDPVELSVKKGDLVCSAERIEQEGWLKVELASDTRRKGFVPLTYVREVAGGPSSSGTTPARSLHQETSTSFTNAALSYGERVIGGHAVPASSLHAAYSSSPATRQQHSAANAGYSNHSALLSSTAAPQEPYGLGTNSNFLANPNAVVEAFMKNEVYFKQLMKQRQESLAKLENGIAEALTDITACKDKNSILARKLRDLDTTIEKERKKWKERVDEEKALVQRAANTSSAGLLSQQTTYTTTTTTQRSSSQGASARSSAAR
jgi:hypothetical protein